MSPTSVGSSANLKWSAVIKYQNVIFDFIKKEISWILSQSLFTPSLHNQLIRFLGIPSLDWLAQICSSIFNSHNPLPGLSWSNYLQPEEYLCCLNSAPPSLPWPEPDPSCGSACLFCLPWLGYRTQPTSEPDLQLQVFLYLRGDLWICLPLSLMTFWIVRPGFPCSAHSLSFSSAPTKTTSHLILPLILIQRLCHSTDLFPSRQYEVPEQKTHRCKWWLSSTKFLDNKRQNQEPGNGSVVCCDKGLLHFFFLVWFPLRWPSVPKSISDRYLLTCPL